MYNDFYHQKIFHFNTEQQTFGHHIHFMFTALTNQFIGSRQSQNIHYIEALIRMICK